MKSIIKNKVEFGFDGRNNAFFYKLLLRLNDKLIYYSQMDCEISEYHSLFMNSKVVANCPSVRYK